MTGWEWQSSFSWESLQLTSHWHSRPCYCQRAYFPKSPRAVRFSALSGLFGRDTNLSSIKIESEFSFVWLAPCRRRGKASWVLSRFQDILIPSLCYSIKTTYYTAGSTRQLCWCDYFYTFQISILTSWFDALAGAFPQHIFKFDFSVPRWERRCKIYS